MKVRVGFVSLGCPKNQVDAEHMMKQLRDAGYEIIQDAALADVAVINTCGFIQSAKQEAIDTILEFAKLKEEGRIKRLIVTGCLSERYREQVLEEIPEVDAVVGLGSVSRLSEIVGEALSGKDGMCAFGKKEELELDGERILSTEPFYAYIKIAEGCDNCCSYCAIPSIRGRFRSRTMESIVAEAEWLASVGVKELVVVAQDTTRYGEDIYGEPKLAELLEKLCGIEGFKWIRTLYSYPERLSDKLIQTVKSQEKLVKYFDIPIQHCNDEILKKMNRKSNKASLVELIEKIRREIPEVVLRTTLIAGFPGETEQQFEELCEFVREMKFDRLGCFAYSPEEGTRAFEMDGQLDEETREKRAEIVMDEQMRIADVLSQAMVGKTVEVVTEGFDRYAECWFGRSAGDAPEIDGKVFFTSERKLAPGEFVKVKVEELLDYDLFGSVI